MDHTSLLGLLAHYMAADSNEARMAEETIRFIHLHPADCFSRSLLTGHITGSAWIVNAAGTHTALIHHRKLDKWFQPGGHCDGDPDVLAVAKKEAIEETGLPVTPRSAEIFDVDIHTIPARAGVPEHLHYDIRFLFVADEAVTHVLHNREVKEVKWIALEDVSRYNASDSIMRMVLKTSNVAR
ncbi:MAG: NUDIX hydrolase [Bacteroidota bacterium]